MVSFGRKKPSMHTGKTVVIEDNEGTLADESFELPQKRDSFSAIISFLKLIALSIVASIVIAAIAMLIALLTVLAAVPVQDGNRIVALRNEFNQSAIPPGSIMLVSTQKANDTVSGRLEQSMSGVPGASTVQIVGGPNAPVESRNGMLYVDGKDTKVPSQIKNQYLDQTYVARCLDGACTKGEVVLVPKDSIIGTVKSKLVGITPTEYAYSTK